jgi:hypothetical protein
VVNNSLDLVLSDWLAVSSGEKCVVINSVGDLN